MKNGILAEQRGGGNHRVSYFTCLYQRMREQGLVEMVKKTKFTHSYIGQEAVESQSRPNPEGLWHIKDVSTQLSHETMDTDVFFVNCNFVLFYFFRLVIIKELDKIN